ncbi:MAG TPA: helix-turn-helix domain-containing protein [Steroidobacteraceae bacterium]|jgi:AcrR family transcriptional regulator|nr:helix-turn-helix domain-containing protein [Steroidobacteraceae bacterium]
MKVERASQHFAPAARRTDRRRVRTRAALLSAGRALLATRDIDGISVDEIVAAADVAKGSFYNHFSDKDVFAREIGGAVRRQVEQAVALANAGVGDPPLRVARGLCVYLRFAIEHRDSARVLWRLNSGSTMADAPINRELKRDLMQGMASRRFSSVDLEVALLLVMGAVVISMRHVLEERVSTPPFLVAANMAAGMLRSLGVARAEARRIAEGAAKGIFSAVAR